MSSKPKYLGTEHAAAFQSLGVVEAYLYRPPYSDEVFDILFDLITDEPRVVLDVGCGTGDLARQLVNWVERVDAVDWSSGMIAMGRSLPGGDHPSLRWIHGRAEEVALHAPYALVTAGETLHWMDWEVVLPRFREALTSHGYLAIVGRKPLSPAWDIELHRLISRFSTNPDYQPIDLITELERRGLFQKVGEKQTAPAPFTQSINDYIEAHHSMSSLSRERMGQAMAAAFDLELEKIVSDVCPDGHVELQIVGHVVWGYPKVKANNR